MKYQFAKKLNQETNSLNFFVKENNIEMVRYCVRSGKIDVDILNQAMLYAVSNNFNSIAILLLENGADVNALNDKGFNALQIACKNGNIGFVKYLCEKYKDLDVNIYSKDGYKGTALMYAVRARNYALVKLLLDNGADVLKESATFEKPLYYLCKVVGEKPCDENIKQEEIKIIELLATKQLEKQKDLIAENCYLAVKLDVKKIDERYLIALNKTKNEKLEEQKKLDEYRREISEAYSKQSIFDDDYEDDSDRKYHF